MRGVDERGIQIVTHLNQPEAAILSVERYERLVHFARRAREREILQMAELSSRFDQRLAEINGPQAHQAVHDLMDERVELKGALRSGDGY